MRRFVLHIEDGIDFRNLERNHLLGISDHFHREVRFAIVGASAYGSSYTRRFIWVEEVRVKGYCETVRAFGDDC